MLCRGMDENFVTLPRDRQRRLPFKIEMLLTADIYSSAQPMLGGGDLESALGKGGVKPANASAYAVEFAVLSGQPIAVASKLLHAPAGARRRNSATDQKATGS